jgi:alpha-mannosidase
MEDPLPNAQHLPLTGDTVTVPIKPYEILTLQVTYPEMAAAAK